MSGGFAYIPAYTPVSSPVFHKTVAAFTAKFGADELTRTINAKHPELDTITLLTAGDDRNNYHKACIYHTLIAALD